MLQGGAGAEAVDEAALARAVRGTGAQGTPEARAAVGRAAAQLLQLLPSAASELLEATPSAPSSHSPTPDAEPKKPVRRPRCPGQLPCDGPAAQLQPGFDAARGSSHLQLPRTAHALTRRRS